MIPTEPIGSLPRPEALIEAAERLGHDDPRLDPLYDDAIRDTIERFEATGSPVITDGEQRKYHNFWTYSVHGLPNTAPDGFKIPFTAGHIRRMPRLTAGPFRYKRYADSYLEVAKRYAHLPVKQAVISPSALSLMYPAEGLPGYSREQFIDDLVAEHETEIRRCFSMGAHKVQIDFTEGRFAMKIDPSSHLLHSFIDLNNLALSRFSPDERQRIGVHTCPGGDRDSTHSADVDYADLLPSLFQLRVGNFYVALAGETDRPRVLGIIRQHLKPDHRVFVGVVAPIDPHVETAEEVRDRVLEAAEYIPLDQLGTTDDCGFSPFSDDTSTTRDTAFAKIRARVLGTILAAEALDTVVGTPDDDEEQSLRSVALQNARTILLARQRADEELFRTKEALRESEERLRAMFNQAAVGIAVAALDGRFVDMNRKFSDILGYGPGELQRLTFLDITHPDDLAGTAAFVRQLLAGSIPEHSLEKRYLRKDGSSVWSLTTVTLLKDADGRPQRFIGVIEDISARKRAEEALREETRNLELLNETGRALASELDLQALVQAVTDAATELSGAQFGAFFYNTTDEKGDSFLLYTLSGAPRAAFDKFGKPRATALFGPTFRGEGPIRCGDVRQDPRYGTMPPDHGMPEGHLPVRSYLAVPVSSRSGEVIGGLFFGHSQPNVFTARAERLVVGVAAQAGIAIDNARLYEAAQNAAEERKALLDSERAARSAAEKMSELKDEFLATLSHELRTPLNAILGWAQVLRNGPKDKDDYLKGIDTIERNARVQTRLIEDLLDMSRVTSGKLRLDVQPLAPASFIEAAIETVTPAAEAKGIALEALLDPAAGPISGDPGRLQQVIWNLLSNAIKFTPKNGKVQIVLARVNSHIEISVTDSGSGITPELIPYLFERFRQGDASTTRRHGGLGLGLSIVKSLVELHGGSVSVTSAGDGQGTTVVVHLPVAAVHRKAGTGGRVHPAAAPATGVPFVTAELAGLRVLVVDDSADARDLIRRLLEDCAAEVITAGTVDEAVALVAAKKPDVLVSDIGMPDADGFDLLKRVRALGPDSGGRIPAIALTAFARSEDRTRALRAGFVVHVSKPVDPSELIATVASVAGRVDDPS